jgi:glyoxylase-like metal-dependent hydrolase (beta-lactamase superfamily II)
VERVLLTHGHHDHYGLAARVADASRARLHGGRLDHRNFLMKHNAKLLLDELARAGFGVGARFGVVASVAAVDRFAEPLAAWDELSGGEVLPGDGYSVVVRSTPGHTPGSLTFEVPEAGVLFSGDTVLKEITPNAVVDEDPENPEMPFRSVSRYFESLVEIGASSAGRELFTGHGAPIPDYAAHYEKVSRRYTLRCHQIERVLGSRELTVRELVTAIFPRVTTLNVFLAYSEILGFLMYLEDMGRVEKRVGALHDLYRLIPAGRPSPAAPTPPTAARKPL